MKLCYFKDIKIWIISAFLILSGCGGKNNSTNSSIFLTSIARQASSNNYEAYSGVSIILNSNSIILIIQDNRYCQGEFVYYSNGVNLSSIPGDTIKITGTQNSNTTCMPGSIELDLVVENNSPTSYLMNFEADSIRLIRKD